MAKDSSSNSKAKKVEADPHLKPLEILVGEWEIEVVHPLIAEPVHGSLTFEWLQGGKFLIERSEMDDPLPKTPKVSPTEQCSL